MPRAAFTHAHALPRAPNEETTKCAQVTLLIILLFKQSCGDDVDFKTKLERMAPLFWAILPAQMDKGRNKRESVLLSMLFRLVAWPMKDPFITERSPMRQRRPPFRKEAPPSIPPAVVEKHCFHLARPYCLPLAICVGGRGGRPLCTRPACCG